MIQDVDALFRGDWRSAKLRLGAAGDMGEQRELVMIVFWLRCIARSQMFQSVYGNVEGAWNQLSAVPTAGGHPGAEPAPTQLIAHLTWQVHRLVEREVADLEALRRIFASLPRGRRELVYAVVEYLTWIEFDPFTVRIHPRDRELTGLVDDEDAYLRLRNGNRKDTCARASQLRQFADNHAGSVTERTWQRVGGYPHLRECALQALAQEPLTRGRSDLPVRLGRLRAVEYARVWAGDALT